MKASMIKWGAIATFMAFTTSACHKTFMRDESVPNPSSPTNQIPQAPKNGPKTNDPSQPVPLNNIKKIDCAFTADKDYRLQIVVDGPKKTVLGASIYNLHWNESADKTYQKVKDQNSDDKNTVIAELEGERKVTLEIPTSLFKKGPETVIVNDKDEYLCK
jgi:hypothetical protein